MSSAFDEIVPDTKDWTWVIDWSCPECGFDPSAQGLTDLPRLMRDNAVAWSTLLARGDAGERPAPGVWSPLEYACHVRDVHVLFAERLRSMLEEDEPTFANWDQDATAVESDYGRQDAAVVAIEMSEAAATVADTYASVTDATKDRPGVRSNGDRFTVETLGTYHLHDVVHHLYDVGREAVATRG